MKKTLYIFSDGELKRKENTIILETEEGRKYVPVENISEIYIFGEVTINKRLLEFLTDSEIVLHFFNYYGYYIGSFYPREHLNSGWLILKQAEFYLDTRKRMTLASKFVEGAIENMKKVLIYYKNRGKNLDEVIEKIEELGKGTLNFETIEQLMAIEGNIREQYYKAFDIIVEDDNFSFESRTKRPPKNRMNALISFGNSLLYTTALGEIYRTHLDPRIGFLHTANFRRFSLNLDVAEIFKPLLVDRVIFTLINKQIIKCEDFEEKLGGIVLRDKGKEKFIREFDERLKTTIYHKTIEKKVSYRMLIRLELYKIEKHLLGEKEYEPFVTWW